MELAAASEYHLALLRARNASPETLRHYGMVEGRFIAWLQDQAGIAAPTLAALEPGQVLDFCRWLQTEHRSPRRGGTTVGHSIESVRQHVVVLKAWSSFLESAGWFPAGDPLDRLRPPKVPRKVRAVLTPAQVDLLLALCASTRQPLRNRAILLLLGDTGMRVSELCQLDLGDIRLATGHAHGRARVRGKGSKERFVYFGGRTSQGILEYVARERTARVLAAERRRLGRLGPREVESIPARPARQRSWFEALASSPLGQRYPGLFLMPTGTRLRRGAVLELFHALGERAGLGWTISPHDMRRYFATQFLREHPGQIAQLQMLLGHSSLGMVLTYARLVESDAESSYTSLMDHLAQKLRA